MQTRKQLITPTPATIPDQTKLARHTGAPEHGPGILFFSGGSALRDVARAITHYTHNTVHLITPFDSGGSSATIREAFNIPALGDIRSRLMALADQSVADNQAIFDLFSHRLHAKASPELLSEELASLADGTHALFRPLPAARREAICRQLRQFAELMPSGFDLHGASVGNLVLAAAFLANRERFTPAIDFFSRLLNVLGTVLPVVDCNGHLAVRLADGEVLVGQHRFTGKEFPPIRSAIQDIWLTPSLQSDRRITTPICDTSAAHIRRADLICYPMGSFYSSIIATLLPHGTGTAIAANPCPKVFVPNTGADPELFGHDLPAQVERLLRTLRSDSPETIADSDVLNIILLDKENGRYKGTLNRDALAARGISVLELPLVNDDSEPYMDGDRLSATLISLCD